MTPKEFQKLEIEQIAIIERAQHTINVAREIAEKCEPPHKVRPVMANDIFPGAIVWQARKKKYGGDFWTIVQERDETSTPIEGYIADDGCRYSLDKAYVKQ